MKVWIEGDEEDEKKIELNRKWWEKTCWSRLDTMDTNKNEKKTNRVKQLRLNSVIKVIIWIDDDITNFLDEKKSAIVTISSY